MLAIPFAIDRPAYARIKVIGVCVRRLVSARTSHEAFAHWDMAAAETRFRYKYPSPCRARERGVRLCPPARAPAIEMPPVACAVCWSTFGDNYIRRGIRAVARNKATGRTTQSYKLCFNCMRAGPVFLHIPRPRSAAERTHHGRKELHFRSYIVVLSCRITCA